MPLNLADFRVIVTGGAGFLGRAVVAALRQRGCQQVAIPRSKEYDLTTESGVARMFKVYQPEILIHLAATVGGIGYNQLHPGKCFFNNMAMGIHLIEHARARGIRKIVQAGTVCAYPKFAPVPFKESDLWKGYPEETNAPYGIAKKSLFVMLDAYHREYRLPSAVVVPVNLYGPWDNFDPDSSHVIPALIRKCEEARLNGHSHIAGWGTGNASREFLYVDDAAEGIVRAAEMIEHPEPINLGTGHEIQINDLVEMIADLCEFRGKIKWDDTKPDGQPRRCLDTSRAKQLLNWSSKISLEEGLRTTIAWWREQQERSDAKA
jgi:GDP-L-fucose synthase